ncbi:MAG: hypothetical protein FWD24_04340 [Treponema sp.]|nr:hypothetical protein [Treponema sp.]
MSEVKKLEIIGTIKDGVGIGIKNIGPIFVNLILWILTCWIPYINVGTTIGMFVGIVAKASKGESIDMVEIFDSKYRKYMGEFFLVCGLLGLGVGIGMVFAIIPGIVIAIAWMFAPLLTIDKGKNPAEALTLSNNATYGNKWRIVGIMVILGLAAGILSFIFALIPIVGIILSIALTIFLMFVEIGIQASLYKQLTSNI